MTRDDILKLRADATLRQSLGVPCVDDIPAYLELCRLALIGAAIQASGVTRADVDARLRSLRSAIGSLQLSYPGGGYTMRVELALLEAVSFAMRSEAPCTPPAESQPDPYCRGIAAGVALAKEHAEVIEAWHGTSGCVEAARIRWKRVDEAVETAIARGEP